MKQNNLVVLLSFLLLSYYFSRLADGITICDVKNVMCIDHERDALLKFKQGIEVDRCGLLTSWEDHEGNQNCCQWSGVRCSNYTGHVVMLSLRGTVVTYDLSERCLQGKVSSSLVDLKQLSYLDLSLNNFQSQSIPTFIGSFVKLKHLNLSRSGFHGEIPHQIGNLSLLTSLDLGNDDYRTLSVNELSWLSHLTLLRYINLNLVDLSKAIDWLQIMNNLPLLTVLHLYYCNLPPPIQWPTSYKNSSTTLSVLSLHYNGLNDSSIFEWLFNLSGINTHLSYLDLSLNELEGPLPSAFGNMHALSYLDLSSNKLEGPIPDTISNIKSLTHLDLSYNNFQSLPKTLGNLCSLQQLHFDENNLTDELPNIIQTLTGCASKSLSSLDLFGNQIWGPVPDSLGTFSSLRELVLDGNRLNGTISENLGKLSMLETLRLASNFLNGTLTKNHFSNLSRLNYLDLSNNRALVFNIDADWVPPFNLDRIFLSSCKLGPLFPKWLLSQTNNSQLDISFARISDSIPESFWKSLPSKISYLNMSHNSIHGTLPTIHTQLYGNIGTEIDMSFNNIGGAVPSFPSNLGSLLLNDNKLSNPIPFLCPEARLDIYLLDLSNNMLSGELPDCWMNFNQLLSLRLENNNFVGSIPPSVGWMNLKSLHLRNNSFSGKLPRSLGNLTSLLILDLGHNLLSGHIPSSVGRKLTYLSILILRSNSFVGEMPLSLCQMSSLQILDLSNNHITGTFPKCINNLTAMKTDLLPALNLIMDLNHNRYTIYIEAAIVKWKRKEWSFGNSLGLVKAIDISKNKLEGEIPTEISELRRLVSLDLSRNNFVGSITPKIGQLTALQVLDLSNNNLSGEIPASLDNLNSLGVLDLSDNHLSGKIPMIPQLQRFDALSYLGNPELCGMPLQECPWDQPPNNNPVNNNENGSEDVYPGLYISVVLGFIIGFWGVCGTLVLKGSWRHAFFRFFDDVKDKLYIMVFVKIAIVWRGCATGDC